MASFMYRKPRVVKAVHGWYVKYYYRIPFELKALYDSKEWQMFRVFEDMNRRKGKDRKEYAELLLEAIIDNLKAGFNPFKPLLTDPDIVVQETTEKIDYQELSIYDALQLFLYTWKARGLVKESYSKYKRYIDLLIAWLTLKGKRYADVRSITQNQIEEFLLTRKGNREYNNTYDFIRTAFNFLLKKKHITESPCAGIEKRKTKPTKHRYYTDKALDDITRALKERDPYTYLVFQTVYYLCVRADKEIRGLKVGNINYTQNSIFVEGKTGERYVPMDDNIKALLLNHIKDAPADNYIFGPNGLPSKTMSSHGLFSKKFQRVRDAIGMDKVYTMFGMRHTRVIHLKQAGAPDVDIMSLTGHKTYDAFAKYMRDLGLTADIDKLNKLGRKL